MDVALVGPVLAGVENHSLAALREAAEDAAFTAAIVPFGGLRDFGSALDAVLESNARFCGISIQSTESAFPSLSFARTLKRRGFKGQIICGGHFATLNAEDILLAPTGVDFVVRFAGERALVGLLKNNGAAEGLDSLPGLVRRREDGTIAWGTSADVGARWARRVPARKGPLPRHLGFSAADFVTSRGCQAHCAYCSIAGITELSRKEAAAAGDGPTSGLYSRATVDVIAEEMAFLWHEKEARVFNFMDDNLLPLDPGNAREWLFELGRALRARGVGTIAFSLQMRADIVTDDVAGALAELGLVRAYVGVDGNTEGQLRALGRRSFAGAGMAAIRRLEQRGVFAVCNGLLIGPTFRFEPVEKEIEALSEFRGAPVHLLPIDVRAGTGYYKTAETRGLLEGNFIWRHARFEDERTAMLGEVILSMPTRLAERSVPVALYDLGYNLGIARRLVPSVSTIVDRLARRYARIADAWNADQIRLLRLAAVVAKSRSRKAIEELILSQRPGVRAHDDSLLAECDDAIVELERAVSGAVGSRVAGHTRGRLLSLAMSLSVAACGGGEVIATNTSSGFEGSNDSGVKLGLIDPPDVMVDSHVEIPSDAACAELRDAAFQSSTLSQVEAGVCPNDTDAQVQPVSNFSKCTPAGGCGTAVVMHFDADGMLESFEGGDPTLPLPGEMVDCLRTFLGQACYPSLACTTQRVTFGSCWIA